MENNGIRKKENQRIALTRRLLLEALLQILERKHINDVSVTELCKCAGINRATFYKHYATPNDVLAEHMDSHIRALLDLQHPRHGKSAMQVLEESCQYIYDQAELFKIYVRNHLDEDFTRGVFIRMIRETNCEHLSNANTLDEDETKLSISYVASGYYYLIQRWIMEDIPKSPKEIAVLLLRLSPPGMICE